MKLNFAPDWRKLWANKHKIKISRQKRWTTRLGDATGWVLQSSLGAIEASRRWHKSLSLCHKSTPNDSQDHCERKLQTMSFGYWRIKTFFELDLQRFIILFRLHFTVAGASFRVLRLTGGSRGTRAFIWMSKVAQDGRCKWHIERPSNTWPAARPFAGEDVEEIIAYPRLIVHWFAALVRLPCHWNCPITTGL